jgi:hypothetical protein
LLSAHDKLYVGGRGVRHVLERPGGEILVPGEVRDWLSTPEFYQEEGGASPTRWGAASWIGGTLSTFHQFFSGFVVPHVSGDFQLSVTSDDMSQLWLSTDASQANLTQRLSFHTWSTEYSFIDGE